MLMLSLSYVAIDGCNGLEALLLSDVGELRIHLLSLAVLTSSGSLEVLSGGANDSSGESSGDLKLTTLEELEEALSVLLLLISSL